MLLLKYLGDYADEFEVSGFRLASEDEVAEMTESVLDWTEDANFQFGSNEGCTITQDAALLILANAHYVTPEELVGLNLLLEGSKTYGHFPELGDM